MTKHTTITFLKTAAIAAILPTATLADLSALEVWDSWKSYAETFGQSVTVGSQEASGDALILRDVTLAMAFAEGNVSGTLEMLEFRERSDGTVALTMAPDFPLSVTIDPAVGEAVDLGIIFRQEGASIIASGDVGNIFFDYLASQVSVDIDKLFVDGVDIVGTMNVTLNDVDGKYALDSKGGKSYTSQLATDDVTFTVIFDEPDDGGSFAMTGSIEDLRSNSTISLPEGIDMADPTAIFTSGVNMQGEISTGGSGYLIKLDNGPESFSLNTSSGASSLDFAILDGSINYGGTANDIFYTFESPQIPFTEVEVKLAEFAFRLLVPLVKSNEPSDFAFLIRLAGFEISDMIWGIFDPGGIMPRDPATISIDVSGQMNWLVDIMDPAIAEEFDGESPAELHSLTINDITLSAVGAEVTGSGDFTFDNSDLETFDGVPAPTGSAVVNMFGLNGLMDRLMQMGFLPPDQAGVGLMMLGLFARAGDGEDTYTSTIEIKGDGSIFANGQQVK